MLTRPPPPKKTKPHGDPIPCSADLDAVSPRGWTPLSYARAAGKYGATEERGIYPEDVLRFYGASREGNGPPALGTRSPRSSFDPSADGFSRERGSYQHVFAHP